MNEWMIRLFYFIRIPTWHKIFFD